MYNLNNNGNIKLAIQKEGRLTSGSLDFLRKAGLEFESYNQRLYSICQNFPLEIFFVRDDDIPDYVEAGTVEMGIIGQNLIYEKKPDVQELLPLDFAFCSLVVAVPKESNAKNISDLKNKTIASSYPVSTTDFFQKESIQIKIFRISGSVEIAPALGVADAIVDLASTGNTLALNGLKPIQTIYDSQAALVANKKALKVKETARKIKQFWRLIMELYKFARKV